MKHFLLLPSWKLLLCRLRCLLLLLHVCCSLHYYCSKEKEIVILEGGTALLLGGSLSCYVVSYILFGGY